MDTFDMLVGPVLILFGGMGCYLLVFRLLRRTLKEKRQGKAAAGSVVDSLTDDISALTLRNLKITDQERIRRLAKSNPDKARELIQLWLQQERANKKK